MHCECGLWQSLPPPQLHGTEAEVLEWNILFILTLTIKLLGLEGSWRVLVEESPHSILLSSWSVSFLFLKILGIGVSAVSANHLNV